MKNTTILYILGTTEIGGAPKHLYTLLSELSNKKIKKIVICPKDGPFFDKFKSLPNTIVYELGIRSINLKTFFKIVNIVREQNVAIIHSHGKGAGLYSRVCGRFTKAKVVHTFHGIHYHHSNSAIYKRLYVTYERIMSHWTHFFINVSNSEYELAEKLNFFNKGSKSKVIYNAIDVNEFLNEKNSKVNVIFEYPNSFIVGMVANFYYAKGHEYLIKAAEVIKEKIPDFKIILIGDGPLRKENEDLAKKLNVDDVVLFLGSKRNIYSYLEIMDIFVLCSRWEGMPISLIEAMYACKPIVGTFVTGIAEIVEDGENGVLVNPESETDLAEAIYFLYRNEKERIKYGINSLKIANEKFSNKKMIEDINYIYEEVLKE